MAWNTATTYTAASAWGATQANGVGNDLRTWGGNVDGGGYNLSNLGALHTTGNAGIGTASPYADSGYRAIDVRGTNGGQVQLGTIAARYGQVTGDASGITLNTPVALPIRLYTNGAERFTIGATGILRAANTPIYADNTAAVAGGLTAGMVYRTAAGVLMIVY